MDISSMTVCEVAQMADFKEEVRKIIRSVYAKRASYKYEFKRDAIMRLEERGYFNAESITELYPLALERRLDKSEFPSELRKVIVAIGDMALNEFVNKIRAEKFNND